MRFFRRLSLDLQISLIMSKRILGLFGVTTLAAVLGLVVYPVYTAHKRRKTSESFTFHAKEELPEEEVATATPTEEISDVSPSAHFLPSIPSSVLSDKTNTTPPSPPKVAKKRYDPSKAALNKSRKKIHFAAGCFWSVELVFQRVVGVYSTKVGYTQGKVDNPTYEDVKTGKSGHAEAVEVVYDTSLVTLEQLMDVFWGKHDATKKNMAGNDKGTQYRSGVYFFTKEQKAVVAASVEGQR